MLRLTAIMKTDIRGSTLHFRTLPEVELEALLAEHRQFVSRLAAAHGGRIVKAEGDGFWVVFPSVTAAALAAMDMQEELRLAQPGKGDARVAMRIALSLGDVLEQENALVGDAVVLAARIESLTPPDEIYVSAAAWAAINKAAVRSALVDTFTLKGFPEPVAVYRLEQTHRIRLIDNQYLVVTDLHGFTALTEESPMSLVERTLDHLLDLVTRVCSELGGTHRSQTGDAYLLTFPDAAPAMAASERLVSGWNAFRRREDLRCSLNVAVHKGALFAFRSYLLSRDINLTFSIEGATSGIAAGVSAIFVTGQVLAALAGTPWAARLRAVDIEPPSPRLAGIDVYRLEMAAPDAP